MIRRRKDRRISGNNWQRMSAHLEEEVPILCARGREKTRGLPANPESAEAGKGNQQCDAATTHGSSELRPDGREQDRADAPVIDLPLLGVLGR